MKIDFVSGDLAGNSNAENGYEVQNRIGRAIVEKIVEMHQRKKCFRVYILIPLLPAFEGEISGDSGNALRTILHYNYASICRGNGLFNFGHFLCMILFKTER